MFNRFTKDARRIVESAVTEAQVAGSTTVEAEHLLLALARRPHPALVLAELTAEQVSAALERETEASLAAVGVEWNVPARRPVQASTRFGASAKLALERSLPIAVARRDHRITSDHVLLGVLEAEVGTVPRALALTGVDRAGLAASV